MADILALGSEDDASPQGQPPAPPVAVPPPAVPQSASSPDDPGAPDVAQPTPGPIAAPRSRKQQRKISRIFLRKARIAYQRKKPGLLNVIGAAAVGFGAGWNNANPKATPIDASRTMQEILYPGQSRREQQYQQQLGLAQLGANAEEKQAQIDAQSEQRKALAADYAAREKAREDKIHADADAAKKKGLHHSPPLETSAQSTEQLRGRINDSAYQAAADAQRPDGYQQFIPDPENQVRAGLRHPHGQRRPPNCSPFLPGVKAGDQVSCIRNLKRLRMR